MVLDGNRSTRRLRSTLGSSGHDEYSARGRKGIRLSDGDPGHRRGRDGYVRRIPADAAGGEVAGGASTVISGVVVILGAAGFTLFVSSLPFARRRNLVDRVEPYLGGLHGRPSPLLTTAPRSVMGSRLQLLWERSRPGSTARLTQRLNSAGSELTPGQFRLEQVTWGVTGIVGVAALFGLGAAAGIRSAPTAVAALGVLSFVTGILARDWLLGRRTIERTARLVQELPVSDGSPDTFDHGRGIRPCCLRQGVRTHAWRYRR